MPLLQSYYSSFIFFVDLELEIDLFTATAETQKMEIR